MTDIPCLAAALDYAARGWPVLPCSPQHKRPLVAADKDAEGNIIRGTGGLSKATTDADQIRAWWKKWPRAMVAVATGADRCFVIDFDPRVDDETGEVFELPDLKSALEEQIGGPLPVSLTAVTQSGGVHLWLRWPDDGGADIRNRGNLPQHVDVRGAGGYVIMPPSVMDSGGRYRWLRGLEPGDVDIADAPTTLVEVLRSRGDAAAPRERENADHGARQRPSPAASSGDGVDERRRKYALAALNAECQRIETAGSGGRNAQLNASAFAIAALVAGGWLSPAVARSSIEAAALANPGRDDRAQIMATIDSGWSAGSGEPRDLSDIGLQSGRYDQRGGYRRDGGMADRAESAGSPPPSAPVPARGGAQSPMLPNGRQADQTPARRVRRRESVAMQARGMRWLEGIWRKLPRQDGSNESRSRGERLAYRIAAHAAAGMIAPLGATMAILALADRVAGDDALGAPDDAAGRAALGGRVWESARRGFQRPSDPGPWLIDFDCIDLPMTDMGNAERFRARFGDDFRFTTAKGWLGWDGRRWAVLDQEQDGTPAAVMAAVFATVRAIQDEGDMVEWSGHRKAGGLNYVWKRTATAITMFDDGLRGFGRASEASARLGCIANLAKRWLTVPIEAFDVDPFGINVLNGTVQIDRDDGGRARAILRPHRRADLNTKLAPVTFDPDAPVPPSPLFTGAVEWAQPDAAVRRYVQQWMGYSASGHTGAQILHFWYGRGANGKSTVIDVVAAALGDYSGTIGIETFLDQGIKKRGDAATPDLARLGGVRLLRASEPERGAKLNEALVKAATGGEPMSVRALHRGFFDLEPRFKLTIGGNYKPDIPGTDEGIWRRLKLVPWEMHRAENERDPDLVDKIKGRFEDVPGELDGVFHWLMMGLLDWRENGFVEPQAVVDATAEYRNDSDPLARFLNLCVEKVSGSRVQASLMHSVFVAWAKAAGEREWTPKGLAQAMKNKGFSNKASNGMQWLDVKLLKQAPDFVDADGKVIDLSGGDVTAPVETSAAPQYAGWKDFDDDDVDPFGA